ncbi:hypothetical protein ACG83_37510 [Frankia sp. R43]|uniref:DUF7224 domain-containing protein n=1 Tax=Frankia sp. R43 TaxID=269536 RepID=UPI0006C9F0E4|nr:hypothetical protein [Frankia sp. R43]KPM51118.1 hypothetical protein ACG83_37510 [Frankia sp. R43]
MARRLRLGYAVRSRLSSRWTWYLRSHAALKAPFFIVPMVLLYETSAFVTMQLGDGYWVTGSAKASYALPFVAPVCAAAAAWEAGRLRRSGALRLAPARSVFHVLLRLVSPIAAAGLLGLLLSYLAVGFELDAVTGHPSPVIAAAAVAVVTGMTAAGLIFGWFLPGVIAAPAVAVLGWILITYPVTVSPPWLRHLNGMPEDCCMLAAQPSAGVFFAPAALAAGAVLVLILLVRETRHPRWMLLPGLAVSAVAVTAACLTARSMGDSPQSERDPGDLRCAGSSPLVCVWPEHANLLSEAATQAQVVRSRLQAIGLDVPGTASEASTADWFFYLPSDADAAEVRLALARAVVPRPPECEPGRPPRQLPPWESMRTASSSLAVPYLQAWLALQVGVPEQYVANAYPVDVLTYLHERTEKPISRQREEYERTLALVRNCRPLGGTDGT